MAQADADVAKNYTALLKRLDAHAGKALRDDQSDFIAYRDQIAGFNESSPKNQPISANSCATAQPSCPAYASPPMQV
ncbi:lysozyme inhibitor LprI family protein [Mesorhizobium sp. M0016]|uniref:lysozyme inhibitor LprI family protein n=1 Tax=Mesorhizobium sp. M0016 TaxID=2956843 RepID=UPI00333741CC